MTKTIILFLAFIIPTIASAGPIDWAKRHKRFLLMEAANAAALSVAYAGIHHCRRGDVEQCFEGYGAANAGFVMDATLSLVAFPAIAEMAWSDGYDKTGFVIGYFSAPVNVGLGIQQYRAYKPEDVSQGHSNAIHYALK